MMKKILVINPMLYTAPLKGKSVPRKESISDCMIVALCNGFVKLGCDVTLIASEEYRPTRSDNFNFKIVYFKNVGKRLISRFPNSFPILSGLNKWLKENVYDLIICSELFSPSTIIAASICRNNVVVWQEMGTHHPLLFKIPSIIWYKFVVNYYISKRNILVVPRSTVSASFVTRYCSNVSKTIINNCVDGEQFVPSEHKDNVIITVSRCIKSKNIQHIIVSFKRYIEKYANFNLRLVIVGDGDYRRELESIAGDSKQIEFKGFLVHDQLKNLLPCAKAFLYASNNDLNVVSVTEAIVSGVPVIMSGASYQKEYINENKLGIVKDNWNEDDLKMLLDNAEQYTINCLAQREKLTNYGIASWFLSI